MSLMKSVRAISQWLLLGLMIAGLSMIAVAQDEPAPPPPPPGGGPGMVMTMQGPGFGGGFFHRELGEGNKIVKGAPLTATMMMTHETTLSDGNRIRSENQTTVYRDSEGRVRREVGFELNTPTTGATKHTMIVIIDPVAGTRYILNPQTKTAHQMPLHGPRPNAVTTSIGGPEGAPHMKAMGGEVSTQQLGAKTILGLQAEGTRVTRTIPAGQIGNEKPIEVVTERWYSTELQIPLSMTHTDPMMGTMTNNVTSISRGEPDASLFQVPSDYKVETGNGGDVFYMKAMP